MAGKRSRKANGAAISRFRLDAGMTQQELAENADLSLRTVQSAEGSEQADIRTLRSLADALNVDYRKLVDPAEMPAEVPVRMNGEHVGQVEKLVNGLAAMLGDSAVLDAQPATDKTVITLTVTAESLFAFLTAFADQNLETLGVIEMQIRVDASPDGGAVGFNFSAPPESGSWWIADDIAEFMPICAGIIFPNGTTSPP